MNKIFQIDKVTELLQYFASSSVTFAELDNSIAATGIGSGFSAGDKILVASSSVSGNNTTHTISTVASGKLVITSATTIADDNAGESITINQVYQGNWQKVDHCAKIVGTINTSGNCSVYIDQSQDGVTTDYTSAAIAVTGGTAAAWDISVVGKYARMRIVNSGADQTIMRAYLNGRSIS